MKLAKRNDPCPCNSGKKFKNCCIDKPQVKRCGTIHEDSEWMNLRVAEGEITEILQTFVKENFDDDIYDAAWDEFEIESRYPIDRKVFEPMFNDWFFYTWIIDEEFNEDLDHTIAELCLEKAPHLFTPFQIRVTQTILKAPFSFYLVKDIIPERRLFLTDILRRKDIEIKEGSGTRNVQKGDIFYCRVINIDNQSICVGFAPYPLHNRFFEQIIDFREDLLEDFDQTTLSDEDLHPLDYESREVYLALLENAFIPPKFSNTDGEDLIVHECFYDLQCTPQEAFDQLIQLCPKQIRSKWSDQIFDENNNLKEAEISWARLNNPDDVMDNVGLGSFTITPGKLKFFVNSDERAARAKEEIRNRLGDKVLFESEKVTPMNMETLKQHQKDLSHQEPEPIPLTPEMKEKTREIVKRHWIAWLDTKIKFLKGQTPREAAQSESGRELLEALFLDFENEKNSQELMQVNVPFLRKELGMM